MILENTDFHRRAARAAKWIAPPVVALLALLMFSTTVGANSSVQYGVQAGDSLWQLSNRYETSIEEIRAHNALSCTTIYVGEVLHIPHRGPVHVVSRGETLFRIARWYGVSVADLQRVNRRHCHLIYPGEMLAIPTEAGIARVESNGSAVTADPAPVASAQQISLTAGEIDLLARLVHSESRGEIYEGKVAVAAVVLNRVMSGKFPSSTADVIYEPGQFEPVMDGTIYSPADDSARRAVLDALHGWDPSWGALYFFNPAKTSNSFMWSRPPIRVIGNHRFAH